MCHVQGALLDLLVALEAVAHEDVVLADDLRGRATEVDGHGGLLAAEVADPEDQVLGQGLLRTPHDPADARVDQAVLMAGGRDGPDVGKAEVPLELGLDERGDHGAGRAVDVDADRHLGRLVVLGQSGVDALDVIVAAGVGDAEQGDDADGVVIDEGHARLRGHVQVLGVHGDQTHLDVPVAAELLPADLVA